MASSTRRTSTPTRPSSSPPFATGISSSSTYHQDSSDDEFKRSPTLLPTTPFQNPYFTSTATPSSSSLGKRRSGGLLLPAGLSLMSSPTPPVLHFAKSPRTSMRSQASSPSAVVVVTLDEFPRASNLLPHHPGATASAVSPIRHPVGSSDGDDAALLLLLGADNEEGSGSVFGDVGGGGAAAASQQQRDDFPRFEFRPTYFSPTTTTVKAAKEEEESDDDDDDDDAAAAEASVIFRSGELSVLEDIEVDDDDDDEADAFRTPPPGSSPASSSSSGGSMDPAFAVRSLNFPSKEDEEEEDGDSTWQAWMESIWQMSVVAGGVGTAAYCTYALCTSWQDMKEVLVWTVFAWAMLYVWQGGGGGKVTAAARVMVAAVFVSDDGVAVEDNK